MTHGCRKMYYGSPIRLLIDQEPLFVFRWLEQPTDIAGLKLEVYGVEAHSVLWVRKRLYEPYWRIFRKIKAANRNIQSKIFWKRQWRSWRYNGPIWPWSILNSIWESFHCLISPKRISETWGVVRSNQSDYRGNGCDCSRTEKCRHYYQKKILLATISPYKLIDEVFLHSGRE